jgi:hypothetical protein
MVGRQADKKGPEKRQHRRECSPDLLPARARTDPGPLLPVPGRQQRGLQQVHASAGVDGGGGGSLPLSASITSPQNDYVKHVVRLRTSAKYRAEANRCLLVGKELIREFTGGELHCISACTHEERPRHEPCRPPDPPQGSPVSCRRVCSSCQSLHSSSSKQLEAGCTTGHRRPGLVPAG